MKLFMLILSALALSSCSVLETVAENQSAAEIALMIATSEAIHSDPEKVCEYSDIALRGVEALRAILDDEILSVVGLEQEVTVALADAGVSPVTSTMLVRIAKDAVKIYQERSEEILSEEAEITAHALLDAVETVALASREGCE